MSKKKNYSVKYLREMAEEYGVADNALFLSLADQYETQQTVIRSIKEEIRKNDDLVTSKEYVKGRKNIYTNPLVRELPKHSDAANKTAGLILDLITRIGKKKGSDNRLHQFLDS